MDKDYKNKDQIGSLQNLTLVHKGGDYLQLEDIEVVLTSAEGRSYSYTHAGHQYNDTVYNKSASKVQSVESMDEFVLNDIGHEAGTAILTSGDSLTLIHNVMNSTTEKWESVPTHFALNTPVTYSVIDMPTGNRVAEGTFIVS